MFTKVRPIFLKRAQGTAIWRAAHSYMSLCAHFVKVSQMHEVVHMVDEVFAENLWTIFVGGMNLKGGAGLHIGPCCECLGVDF